MPVGQRPESDPRVPVDRGARGEESREGSCEVGNEMVNESGNESGNEVRSVTGPKRSGRGFESVHFDELPGVPCPCGVARRAFAQVADFPGTVHVTEIHETAKRHYHKRLTETYYVLECSEGAYLELDDVRLPVHVGSCVLIRPYTRHRAVGRMKVLIVVLPKFDEADEWFDEPASVLFPENSSGQSSG